MGDKIVIALALVILLVNPLVGEARRGADEVEEDRSIVSAVSHSRKLLLGIFGAYAKAQISVVKGASNPPSFAGGSTSPSSSGKRP